MHVISPRHLSNMTDVNQENDVIIKSVSCLQVCSVNHTSLLIFKKCQWMEKNLVQGKSWHDVYSCCGQSTHTDHCTVVSVNPHYQQKYPQTKPDHYDIALPTCLTEYRQIHVQWNTKNNITHSAQKTASYWGKPTML